MKTQARPQNTPKIPSSGPSAAGTGGSVLVTRCQACGSGELQSVFFLGFFPPSNRLRPVGEARTEEPVYPLEWLFCPACTLVQLSTVVDPALIFPPDFPYTTGLTKALRDNFAELYAECASLFPLTSKSLIVDIGSNDGTLLKSFKAGGHRVLGVEPTQVGKLAEEAGVPTVIDFFGKELAESLRAEHGPADVITCTNAFAHIEDVHGVLEGIARLLPEKGIFVSENHSLAALVETLQYDTIYHEHLRYYSFESLTNLLAMHGLEPVHAKKIPTHGGSVRVYAAKKGAHPKRPSVDALMAEEKGLGLGPAKFVEFRERCSRAKLELLSILSGLKNRGKKIYAIGAPARGSTLAHYTGLDDAVLDCTLEVKGSHKVGKYMAGTMIPILEEEKLFEDPPDYALFLSWHIAEGVMPKLREKGYRGGFIVPLPTPRLIEG